MGEDALSSLNSSHWNFPCLKHENTENPKTLQFYWRWIIPVKDVFLHGECLSFSELSGFLSFPTNPPKETSGYFFGKDSYIFMVLK